MVIIRRRLTNNIFAISTIALVLKNASCQLLPKGNHDSSTGTQDHRVLNSFTVPDTTGIDPRIVGGTPVAKGTYPYYATTNVGQELCGGTLIWPDIILTAAHCGDAWLGGVRIGGTLLNGTDMDGTEATSELVPHPSFTPKPATNDIMIVKLNGTFPDVEGATLNFNADIPATGDQLSVIGFGFTEENGENSDVLLTTNVDAVSFSSCNDVYGFIDDESMICAGNESGGQDSCNGDSGGPLFTSSGVQVGIVSFANGCAQPGVPAVYTRLSAYTEWILSTICSVSSAPPDECASIGTSSPTPAGTVPTPISVNVTRPPVPVPTASSPPVLLPTIVKPPSQPSRDSPVPSYVASPSSSPSGNIDIPFPDFGMLAMFEISVINGCSNTHLSLLYN
jgi:trypsin